jgi:hypothetical protein
MLYFVYECFDLIFSMFICCYVLRVLSQVIICFLGCLTAIDGLYTFTHIVGSSYEFDKKGNSKTCPWRWSDVTEVNCRHLAFSFEQIDLFKYDTVKTIDRWDVQLLESILTNLYFFILSGASSFDEYTNFCFFIPSTILVILS